MAKQVERSNFGLWNARTSSSGRLSNAVQSFEDVEPQKILEKGLNDSHIWTTWDR